MKAVWAAYLLAIAVLIAAIRALYPYAQDQPRRIVTLRFHDDHLTLETGFFSRTRGTVDMAKIQDVTVQQTFGQRIMKVGDLTLESAGESGAMGIRNPDRAAPRSPTPSFNSSRKSQCPL
jgi:uncharacterized membrane protein YdbT with pleckstrin-like domain